jgi:hypothetical protein
VGVSKQDWKDYQSKTWAGLVKPTMDELMQEFAALSAAIDGDDAATFLAYTQDDGTLMQAAMKASSASGEALTVIQDLALQGNQRRFANKNAITVSDAAINSVMQYHYACDLLVTGLVRGVQLEHNAVDQDQSQMASIKSGNLKERLDGEKSRVSGCYDYANDRMGELAAIDKIGVV